MKTLADIYLDQLNFINYLDGGVIIVDIKIKTDECNFKYRVAGIIISDDKVLTVKMCDNSFYCLPGGHVEVGESTVECIFREMKEETGYNVINPKLIAVTENFFASKINKQMHEVGFYYILDLDEYSNNINKEDYIKIEHDKCGDIKLEFKWFDISKLNDINIQPEFLKEKLMKKDFMLTHYIIGK